MKQLSKLVVWPEPGSYVVAVSGGADSISLLDLLASRPDDYRLTVGHFNDGWEGDDAYEAVAEQAAARYGLPFRVHHGKSKHTEAAARQARYGFLRRVKEEVGARAIVTAHHRDDLEETVILNVLRGSGRHGLTPFARTEDIIRPLVAIRKAELKAHAEAKHLQWCNDRFNDDMSFKRNRVRHNLLPALREEDHSFTSALDEIIQEAGELNPRIDAELHEILMKHGRKEKHSWQLEREVLLRLDPDLLQELIVAAAKDLDPSIELDRRAVESLAVELKTSRLRGQKPLRGRLSAIGARDTVTIVFTP